MMHLRRWEHVLRREKWNVEILSGAATVSRPGERLILLAEISAPQSGTPSSWISRYKEINPASLIAFGDPAEISNRSIAALLAEGADDFISTDIDTAVLTAKIKAVLRRVGPQPYLSSAPLRSSDGLITAYCAERRVTIRNGKGDRDLEKITPKEFEILTLLLCHEGKIVPRETILDNIWAEKAEAVNPETVDKHVESIRRKLGKYGSRIRTIYGSGYLLAQGGG